MVRRRRIAGLSKCSSAAGGLRFRIGLRLAFGRGPRLLTHRSPFLGPLFETFVASEIVKTQISAGRPRALYYFRDQQGLEVDFILPRGNRRLFLLEAKASKTVTPKMGEALVRLSKSISGYHTECMVVHRSSGERTGITALRPGARSSTLEELLAKITHH